MADSFLGVTEKRAKCTLEVRALISWTSVFMITRVMEKKGTKAATGGWPVCRDLTRALRRANQVSHEPCFC